MPVLRLDELDADQRRLIEALIAAKKHADEKKAEEKLTDPIAAQKMDAVIAPAMQRAKKRRRHVRLDTLPDPVRAAIEAMLDAEEAAQKRERADAG